MYYRCFRTSVLFVLITTLVAISFQLQTDPSKEQPYTKEYQRFESTLNRQRIRRATARRPGFFKTLFSVIYEQWNDTRNTITNVNKLINNNFLPENAVVKTTTPSSSSSNTNETTTEYKITRSEFNKIVRRNLKGLIRLYNIELRDALKQSEKTNVEFRRNITKEISKFL